ncbi:AraC family transcriptional regulator [Rhodococcus sp. SORGH_AS_0303]|uniref:AraC family transcriptional regulator n=1 Tax=Rhodococcus sp. SORGH_AS_0303 TaxID=3041753 RepID=UPI0027879399|nr:AraC family transcriptional regulator [Rhodococcus sp. SORGH_AS_0303]MDQ1201822.1 AraC-like DNA-binding protein [Rhodococcus sp. SORGH_AS_0303]
MSAVPAIRSAGLRGFRATVAELGGDAEAYAVAAGLPVDALDADDLLVEDVAMAAVLEIAAAELACPDLGLRIARRQDLGMLGPLALAIQNSSTVGEALECTEHYLFIHAQSLSLRAEPDPYGTPGIVALRYGTKPGVVPPVQGTDMGLGFLHRATIALVGGSYGLRSVELPYVPAAPVSVYENFFGVAVSVGRPAAVLRVPATLQNRPLHGGDSNLKRLALAFLARQGAGPTTEVAPRVRTILQQSLGTTPPHIDGAAHLLNLHPRTLQRRLAGEGTSFAAIVDEVRRTEAHRYLTTTSLPMSQIAAAVGLSEQSAFTRACRRWWNATPTTVRRGAL